MRKPGLFSIWRKAETRTSYDVLIVGSGGHGLATAWFLSRWRGMGRIGVIERIGVAGSMALASAEAIRPENVALFELSRSLYRSLGRRLDFAFRAGGVMRLCRTREDHDFCARMAATMRTRGAGAAMIGPDQVRRRIPLLAGPVTGALFHANGGVTRPDAVAAAFARAAAARGVEVMQADSGIRVIIHDGNVTGLETTRGTVQATKVVVAGGPDMAALAATGGVVLPLEQAKVQGLVTEPVDPVLAEALIGGTPEVAVSQNGTGEVVVSGSPRRIGETARHGAWPPIEETTAGLLDFFPSLSGLRLMRTFEEIVDETPDHNPIIGFTPVNGLFVSCGWGTAANRAIPGAALILAATIARNTPHPLARPFALERFDGGRHGDGSRGTIQAH